MNGYTVTITPSDGQPGSRTIITVDTANGAPRVNEFTVQADGDGLTAQNLPTIDLAGLVAALSPSTAAAAAPAATGPTPAESARSKASKAARTNRRAAKPATKSRTTPNAATRRRRRSAAAEEESAPTTTGKRQYRRMPPQDEIVAAWELTRSPTRLAAHFDVPRHTANGWLRRLRSLGLVSSTS